MKRRRILLVLLALLIAVAMAFSGCKQDSPEPEVKDNNEPKATEGTELETEEDVVEDPYKERVTVSILTRDKFAGGSNMVEDDTIKALIEEKFNMDIEYTIVPSPEHREIYTKQNMMMSTGEVADIIQTRTDIPVALDIQEGLLENDMLVDVRQMVADNPGRWPLIEERISLPDASSYELSDGNLYTIPAMNGAWNHAFVIRKDWLDKLGLEIPTTLDELYNVLKVFVTEDPDGTGNFGMSMPGAWWLGHLRTGYNQAFVWKVDDDKIMSEWVTPEQKDAVKFIAKMFEEKLIDPEIFSHQGYHDELAKFQAGKVGVLLGHSTWIFEEKNVKKNFPEADVALVPVVLNGPNGPARFSGMPLYEGIAISKGAADPERIFDFVEYVMSDEAYELFKYGIEGVHYTMDGDERVRNTEKIEYEGWAEANKHWWFHNLLSVAPDYDPVVLGENGANTEEDVNAYIAWEAELVKAYADGNIIGYPLYGIPLDTASEYETVTNDIVNTYFAEFVLGQRDIDADWDKFIEEYRSAGYDQMEAEANEKYFK